MYASPGQNIVQLCRTGNYQFLPIVTNAFGFFNTLIWLLYGVLTTNIETIASNGTSFLVNCAQIGFWIYYFVKAVRNKETEKEDMPDDGFLKKDGQDISRDSNTDDDKQE